ncbi:MAG: class I SAM-dependent methyltransferase [Acidobacteriota bacterium]
MRSRRESRQDLLLDLGCGTSGVLREAGGTFSRSIGFDISEGMRAVARERGFLALPAELTELPVRSSVADLVTAFSVLHHLYDPAPLIAEAARVLKPGGFFYSDWDPHRPSKAIEEGPVYTTAAAIARRVLFGSRQLQHEGEEVGDARLAEYHVYQGEKGFTVDRMRALCAQAGLTTVHAFAHSNAPGLARNRLRDLPRLFLLQTVVKAIGSFTFRYETLGAYVLLVARKPRA